MLVTTRTRRDGTEPAREVHDDRLRPADGNADVSDRRDPRAVRALDLEPGRREREARLVAGHVVAREGVVGPAGEQEQRVGRRAAPRDRASARAPARSRGCARRQLVHVDAVEPREAVAHVAAAVVEARAACAGRARPRAARASAARVMPSSGKTSTSFGWSTASELDAVEVEHLLELVRDAQLVAALARARSCSGAMRTRLDRVRLVPDAGRHVVSHLAAAQEVRDELEALAVPGVEVRDTRTACGRAPSTSSLPAPPAAGPSSVSVWTTPEGQITRTASGARRAPRPKRGLGRPGHRHGGARLELLAQAARPGSRPWPRDRRGSRPCP